MFTGTNSGLPHIRRSGALRVGSSLGFSGLSAYDESSGSWTGFDTDIARAVAVALLGDEDAVEFLPLASAERFDALDDGRIDLGSYNSSITLTREAEYDVTFVHPLLYDGEVFATRPGNLRLGQGQDGAADGSRRTIRDTVGTRIGMLAGSTTADNVSRHCGQVGVEYTAYLYRTPQQALGAYLSGEVDVYCLDSYLLAGELSRHGDFDDHVFLDDQVSLEAMSPVVRGSDWAFTKAVRWVLFALIEADNLGLTRDSVLPVSEAAPGTYLHQFLRPDKKHAENLGLLPDFTSRILERVGSYSDIFERNLGAGSPLKQGRKANRLRTSGGMLYAPLFI
ncbi:transporter substrate-binding domain-containing protein [Streptomyces sp. NPDC051664]|uniref:transporter substrate-binding domain-containing protein n=1 Tax=Streptomyces sp. NPDC051664 TaxID=3365668 RepID=UPI0037B754F3